MNKKGIRLITSERHHYILQQLKQQQFIKVQDLVEQLQTSESTIRRDLAALENDHLLNREHGGATRIRVIQEEPSMQEKVIHHIQEKQQIAACAANLIQDKECIYLDAGSTIREMIPFIEAKDIIVVTNGLNHVSSLLEKQIDTYLLGGNVKASTEAVIGITALEQQENYQFDKVFLGMNGIHTEFGYTTADPEEAALKRNAMKQGMENFVLADHSKMGMITFSKVEELSKATVITNKNSAPYIDQYKTLTTVKVVET